MSDRSLDTRLNEYLDGLLSAEEIGRLKTDLKRNPELAIRLAELQKVVKQFEHIDELEPSRDISEAVLHQLGPINKNEKVFSRILSFELLATGVLAYFASLALSGTLSEVAAWRLQIPQFADLANRFLAPQSILWEEVRHSASSGIAQWLRLPALGSFSADIIWIALALAVMSLFVSALLLAEKKPLNTRDD